MTDAPVWWNGRVMAPAEARLDPRDRAVLYGVGLFETLRAYQGVPFALDDHWRRLRGTAERLRLEIPIERGALTRAIRALLEACELTSRDASVRITMTGGLDGGGIEQPPATPPSLLIHARPVPRPRGPLSLRVCRAGELAHRAIPGLKSIGYLPSVLARMDARERGYHEAIVALPGGQVLEGANSAILVRVGDHLVTPPQDDQILPSVTCRLVVGLARRAGISVVERSLHWDELLEATEILCVGSVREIASVVDVEGHPVGRGRPGPVAKTLFRAYRARVLGTRG